MTADQISRSTWPVIVCASILLMFAFGLRSSLGLFVAPIAETNGWGRDILGLALAIQNLAWGVIAVLAGGLADRFGNVVVIVGGAVLYALGLWLTSGVSEIWVLNSSTGLLIGAGVAGTGFGVVLPLMAKAVSESRRQWVLGVGTAAGSMGQFLMAPLAQQFIDLFGWSGALNVMSLMALGMVLLVMPLAAKAGNPAGSGTHQAGVETLRTTVTLARGHLSYWLLTVGFFVCGFHVAFITVHLPGYLTDKGFDPSVAAWSIGLIGLCNVFGALGAGILSGRISMRLLLIGIYSGRAVVITCLLLFPMSIGSIILFSCVMGFLWLATVPPTTGLVAVMFGTRYMATLYGVVFLGHQVGSFCGVYLGGWIYTTTGSYDGLWWIGVALSLVAVALHWPIREEPASAPQLQTS